MVTQEFQEILTLLKTGDVVLFSGKTGFSRSIKWFTVSHWTHVGMVIRLPEHPDPLIWESLRIPELPDVIDGTLKSGVQLLNLADRLRTCVADIAIRSLNEPITSDMNGALLNFRETVRNRPYEQSMLQLFRSAWDGPFGQNQADLSSIFCSELIAGAYQAMGLLPCNTSGGQPSNEYTPKYFSEQGPINLLGGYSLGPTQLLKGQQ